jgi:hypothetical protein
MPLPRRITAEDDARTELERLTSASSTPSITSHIDALLEKHKKAALWEASTAYTVGDVVQPNSPDGHRYICTTAGTSSTTEPEFDTARDAATADGTVLVWSEAGPEYTCLWDLNAAAYEGWGLKEAAAICAVDIATGDTKISNSQIFDHIKAMRRYFAPTWIG